MSKADWFRNETWDEEISARFEAKLQRARGWKKPQYLRIQAGYLTHSHPEAALRILDRYLEFPEHFDRAQAFVDQAEARLSLGRIDDAIGSFEKAIASEREFPNVRTVARLSMSYLIATRNLGKYYDRALEVLSEYDETFYFPVELFRYHAAYALIASAKGAEEAARAHADRAIKAASQTRSGFRYHPDIGLVTEHHDDVIRRLQKMLSLRS